MDDISTDMNSLAKKDTLHDKAVAKRAIYVAPDGSLRLDLGKLAEIPEGRSKLLELAKESSLTKR